MSDSTDDMTEFESVLMQVCIGWTPSRGALEDDPRLKPFLADARPARLEAIRKMQLLLIHGRLTAGSAPKSGA